MIMWVEETKNGKYKFIERYTDYMTGKIKRVSVVLDKNTAQSRKTAQRTLDAKIDAVYSSQSNRKEISLKTLVNAYLADQKQTVKQSTYTRNHFACNTLMEILGEDVLVSRLNAKYIRSALLATGKAPGTLNEHLVRLKALLRWGYHNDFLSDISFLDKVDSFKDVPHKVKIQDKYLETNELKILLDGMQDESWKLLTQFLVLSGLRIGELAALKEEDVDLKNKVIHVNKTYDAVNNVVTTPKTLSSIRDVFLQDDLKLVCKQIRLCMLRQGIKYGYGKSNLFFQHTDGGYMHYYSYNKYLRENSERLLGRKITVHALRHTHASLLMENGVNIDTISRRLGHENSQITKEIYLHVTEKLKEKDNEQIAAAKII